MLSQEARAGPASAHVSPSFHFLTFGQAPWRDGEAFGMSAMYYWQSLLLSWLDWAAAWIMGPGVWFVKKEKKRIITRRSSDHQCCITLGWSFLFFISQFAFCWCLLSRDIMTRCHMSVFFFPFPAAAKMNLASSLCLWVPWVRLRRLSTENFSASTWLTLQTSSLSHPTFATGVRNPNKETLSN